VPTALAAAAVLAGALLQSATGFGFSLLAAPLLFAILGPPRAVGALLVLGVVLNVLTLASERRKPRPLARESALMLGWAAPGTVAGVVVLRSVSALALQLALTAAILATLILRRRAVSHTPAWAAPLAGFSAGALTTATSTSGPPLITYLLGRGHDPIEVRDTLTFCFICLAALGALALWITGTGQARPDAGQTAVLVPAVVVGSLLGRRAFAKLVAGGRYEPVLTGILLAAVALGLIAALAD
jgi:uncharacterized membrane protein YfcA